MQPSPEVKVDPRRYFESVDERRNKRAAPVSYTHLTLPTICSV